MSENWPENDPNWKLSSTFQSTSEDDGPIIVEVPGPSGSPALDRFWAVVRRLPRYIFLGTNLVRDDRVPRRVKATIAVGGIYAISPIDLIPGIIPVAGQIDDLVVLLLALRRAVRTCAPEVAEEHLRRAGLTVEDFDNDLRAVRDTAIWLAHKGIRATRRFVASSGRRLRSLWANR